MRKLRTLCYNCGKVLTDEEGVRLENGIFKPAAPKMTQFVTWALCEECVVDL